MGWWWRGLRTLNSHQTLGAEYGFLLDQAGSSNAIERFHNEPAATIYFEVTFFEERESSWQCFVLAFAIDCACKGQALNLSIIDAV